MRDARSKAPERASSRATKLTILRMAVLIDDPVWPAHGRLWGHLVSDSSLVELHAFARAAGIPERGFDHDHYDYPAHRYDELVAQGAEPVTGKQLVARLSASGLRVAQRDKRARFSD